MCYVLACLYQSYLVNVRTFCSACSAKGDCDQSYALPYNFNPRTRFTAPLCQACKAIITRHVVSVGQTATGASSRSGLIIAGDSIASYSRRMLWGNARNAIPLTEESESTQQSTLTLRTIYADGKGSHKLCIMFFGHRPIPQEACFPPPFVTSFLEPILALLQGCAQCFQNRFQFPSATAT